MKVEEEFQTLRVGPLKDVYNANHANIKSSFKWVRKFICMLYKMNHVVSYNDVYSQKKSWVGEVKRAIGQIPLSSKKGIATNV